MNRRLQAVYCQKDLCRVFSCDIMAAMLLSLNKGTATMLVSPNNLPGIELYSYANEKDDLLFWLKITLIDDMSENALQLLLSLSVLT